MTLLFTAGPFVGARLLDTGDRVDEPRTYHIAPFRAKEPVIPIEQPRPRQSFLSDHITPVQWWREITVYQ